MYKLYHDPKPTCLFNLEQFQASPAALPSSPASQSLLQAVRQAPGSDLSTWDSRLSAWRSVVSLPHWSGTSTSHHVSTTVLPRGWAPHAAWDGPGHFCPLLWCTLCALSLPLGSTETFQVVVIVWVSCYLVLSFVFFTSIPQPKNSVASISLSIILSASQGTPPDTEGKMELVLLGGRIWPHESSQQP